MSSLHEFKIYTTAKVWGGYVADFTKLVYSSIKSAVSDPDKASSVEQLYPSQQGVYTFQKSDPDTLIKSNKMLIDQAATILMLDERAFSNSMMKVVRYLAEYCLKLPASKYYHHVQPGSLFYHLIETGNFAAERAKAHPELMSYTDPSNRSDYETIFPIGAWLLGVLHDIAKPMTDMEIIPLDSLGRPIKVKPWLADEQTLYEYLISCKAHRYKMLYRDTREYHQHDVYRVWFISKLLSFFSTESGLREPLKHIIPIHASAKHPLNFLVKEADRLSTRRDTQRYRPLPMVSNYAKAFVDVLQDYDTVKRIDDVVELPYFFSKWAIHIPFPESVRVLINQVNNRFSAYTDIPIPVDPDAWANLLGAEHALLVANQVVSDYRSLRYPDINRYVYDVIVEPGTNQEDRIRVISLAREHLSLVKGVGSREKEVVFKSAFDADPNTNKQSQSSSTKKPKKSPAKPKQASFDIPSSPPPIPAPPDIDTVSDYDDDEFDIQGMEPVLQYPPEYSERAPVEGPAIPPQTTQTHNSKSEKKAPNIDSGQTPVTSPSKQKSNQQVKAEIAPPLEIKRPPLAIDLSALDDIVESGEHAAPHTNKPPEQPPAESNNQSSADLVYDVVTPFEFEHNDVEVAIGKYLNQIPSNHVLKSLFNDPVLIYDDNIKIALWAIYNDLQQYDLSSLFAQKHRAFLIIPEGLAILRNHLTELLGPDSQFDEAVSKQVQGEVDKLIKSGKTDIYNRIFSSHKKRSYRLFNTDISLCLLHKDKQALSEYLKSVELEMNQ